MNKPTLIDAFYHPRFGLVLQFTYLGRGWIDIAPAAKSEDEAKDLLAFIMQRQGLDEPPAE